MKRTASEVQRHYRNFTSDLLGELNKIYIVGLDAETNSQGDLIGFISLGPFQYKIQSEQVDHNALITIEGPGTRGKSVDSDELFYDPTWIDSKTGREADKYDLFNVYTRKRLSDEILSQRGFERRVFRVDPKIVAKRIHKMILKLEKIALSDKAVSDRAERKRLRREKMRVASSMVKLQPLPYEYDALEPIISEKAMRLHHLSHQQGYVDKLNKTLEQYPDMLEKVGSLHQLISNPKWIPQEIKQSVIDFGGGVWNHAFYWNCLSPNPVRYEDTPRSFQDKVNKTFGSYEDLRDDLILEGTSHFGSGWVWLAETKTGELKVYATLNQNTPMMRGHRPILTIDLWEHAYYPDYDNGRKEFLEQVIDNLLSWGYA